MQHMLQVCTVCGQSLHLRSSFWRDEHVLCMVHSCKKEEYDKPVPHSTEYRPAFTQQLYTRLDIKLVTVYL